MIKKIKFTASISALVWLNLFSAQGAFEPALDAFDSDFVAHVIANIAHRTYSDTAHNLKDFQYGGAVISSVETLNGDVDRTWNKRPFIGQLDGRVDTWGAVYTHENRIVSGFHGSYWLVDWMQDFQPQVIAANSLGHNGSVHTGFAKVVDCLFDNFEQAFLDNANLPRQRLTKDIIRDREFIFTGHSLGGALAIISAAKFASKYKDILEENQIKIITFSAPRVGTQDFINSIYDIIPQTPSNIINFVCGGDSVPRLPLTLMQYQNIGLWIDVLAFEQTWDKAEAGWMYTQNGGLDLRVHVLKRIYPFVKPVLGAFTAALAALVFKKPKTVAIAAGGSAAIIAAIIMDYFPVAIESAKMFHEIPNKKTIRKAWASAQMHKQPLDADILPNSAALYYERSPIGRIFYRWF